MNGHYEESPKVQVTLADMMPLFQEQLAAGQKVRFIPHGNSMWPMLRSGQDIVELSPLPQRLKKFDLPLYQRSDGKFFLHRIICVEQNGYTCVGDGRLTYESGIRREQMIALVTAFCRDGHWYSVTHPAYWLYCRLWPICRLAWHCWKKLCRLYMRLHQ